MTFLKWKWGEGECSRQKGSLSKGWEVRKHNVLENGNFSKVYTLPLLHILLVNALDNDVCFNTGLC